MTFSYVALFFVDIDECEQGSSACSQGCRNTNGSFICICDEGYQAHNNDPKFCVGMGAYIMCTMLNKLFRCQ